MDFAELYGRYAQDVFRFTLFLTGNRAVAEDLTAETFARALAVWDDVRASSVKAYLMSIARNLARDCWRRQDRTVSLDFRFETADSSPGADRRMQDWDTLLKALAGLSAMEREALLLATQTGMPYERIAEVLGCSIAAVKVRVHRARLHLRQSLTEKESLP
jgi:RNA polymerase sigma-70 factor, ECF subfamily